MSSALAIAGVTAVLRDLLNNGFVNNDVSGIVGGNVEVSALAPDLVLVNGNLGQPQLNIYMYLVTPNVGWRNECLPSTNSAGQRVNNQPLALDLHYLLTAYGVENLQAEILIGYAMQLLHENPVFNRAAINTALNPDPDVGAGLPPALQALSVSGLADQVEQIKFTPEYLNTEEMSKLWTSFQSNYRPTEAYQATVALIEAEQPTRTPLPVLTRGPVDPVTNLETGIIAQPHLIPPVPTITEIELPNQQIAVRLGEPEPLTLRGHHLNGDNIRIQLTNRRLDDPIEIAPQAGSTQAEITVLIPNQPTEWVAGIYQILVLLEQPIDSQPGQTEEKTTNEMPLLLAPDFSDVTVSREVNNDVTVTLTASPQVLPNQTVSLILGQNESPAEPIDEQTAGLTFRFGNLAAADYWARLRVDGVDSLLIDPGTTPPTFIENQRITVPPA